MYRLRVNATWHDSAHEALRRAVGVAGNQTAFERLTGAKQQKVSVWLRDRKVLPGEYVLAAERETGVSRHDLRPDLYPRDDAAPATLATAR